MANRSSTGIVDREFPELRAKLLELAASFDRISRIGGGPDQRLEAIERGLAILSDARADKARRIQELFSREYSPDWRSRMGV